MTIEMDKYRDATVMRLSGEIDMYSSPGLRKELLSLVAERVSPLIVDFRGVSYIDSSGIATFVEGLKGMRSFGGRLKFVAVPEGIMEIFTFSKLDRVFEIYGSADEALSG